MTRRGQRGQALIEFALTLPILAIMLMGAWALGRAGYDAQIVQETSFEAGKMSAIDRASPDDTQAWQMSQPQTTAWINQAANQSDPSIAVGSINGTYDYSTPDDARLSGVYKGIDSVAKGGAIAPVLNPGLRTMHLTYNFDTGLGPGYTFPITFDFYYTHYQMTWLPGVTR